MTTLLDVGQSTTHGEESVFPALVPATERQRTLLKPLLMALDLATLSAAAVLAFELHRILTNNVVANDQRALGLILASLPFWLIIFSTTRLYSARFLARPLDEFRRVGHACTLGAVLLALGSFGTKANMPRSLVLFLFFTAVTLVTVERTFVRLLLRQLRSHGQLIRPVVVVGDNAEADAIAAMLAASPDLGYDVRGFVDCAGRESGRLGVLATVRDTLAAVQRTGANGVIIAATAVDHATSNRLIRVLTEQGIHVELSSTLVDVASNRLVVRPLGRMAVMYVEPVQRVGWRAYAKRSLDVTLASLGLLITFPVLVVAAIAIRLDSRGPVLFRQDRVGRGGRLFKMLKLRTMVPDAEALLIDLRRHNEADGPLFKMRDDPRVTRVGRVLRKLSIDEIPQLWNVLRNDMSMVGPRPAMPSEMAGWGADLHARLRVKPGITGMWQVSARSSSSFQDYERLDLYYVDNWSLLTDLWVIAQTVPSVLRGKGAF